MDMIAIWILCAIYLGLLVMLLYQDYQTRKKFKKTNELLARTYVQLAQQLSELNEKK